MWGTLVLLIVAGEVIFALPFHITRFFRPTFLSVFQLNNTQLGDMFAVYGVIAMVSYFPGGVIADRLPAKPLMIGSLLATALGGLFLLTKPNAFELTCLFGYWGVTTILLFWSAMLKSIRLGANPNQQGRAFGVLDGGRGLIASLLASAAVLIFATITVDPNTSTVEQQKSENIITSFNQVIIFYTAVTLCTALLLWRFWHPEDRTPEQIKTTPPHSGSISKFQASIKVILNSFKATASNSLVWLQAGIVVCAYCGYKSLDNYGVLVTDVYGWSQLESSQLTSALSYSRPFAAIVAGILADRWRPSNIINLCFTLALIAFGLIAFSLLLNVNPSDSNTQDTLTTYLLIVNLFITALAVFALRAVYFALLEESHLAVHRTGMAIGLISFIGYTPDIFFASITGRMLDSGEISTGFVHYFYLMTAISVIGLCLGIFLVKKLNTKPYN